jgi:hypothetical protein
LQNILEKEVERESEATRVRRRSRERKLGLRLSSKIEARNWSVEE